MPERIDQNIVELFLDPQRRSELFARARDVRAQRFGKQVFAYGFDYFSTYCANECAFCLYRRGNEHAPRYRHEPGQIVQTACELADSGVHLIDLTMGEDPYFIEHPQRLVDIVRDVKDATGLPVMVSPGAVDVQWLAALKDAGATWLALYQETFDRSAFARLRVGQSYDGRMRVKHAAAEAGLLVEEGVLTGWGDTPEQLADSLLAMNECAPSQVRVMTFVPQPGTPLQGVAPQESDLELAAIAFMRILYPDALIPASLDVEGPAGLRARLDAGANVITSIIPPGSGLEGVARTRDIEDGGRTLGQIAPTIAEAGLEVAAQQAYTSYLEQAKARVAERARAVS